MSERKSDSGTKSVLEIILEFGHKAVLKDEVIKVHILLMYKENNNCHNCADTGVIRSFSHD